MTIEGFDMPGRNCSPHDAPSSYENVHVGVQRDREAVDLVRGDAPTASWTFDVRTKVADDGTTDFAGPYVHGRRADRFLYLSWGTVDSAGEFGMFRRAKLHFADCDDEVMADALRDGELICRVRMTDARGYPRCARVRAPDAVWTAA